MQSNLCFSCWVIKYNSFPYANTFTGTYPSIQIFCAVGLLSPAVSSVKGKDVSGSVQDLKSALKSCVRITKDKSTSKKNPSRSQVRQSVDSSTTCQNEISSMSNGHTECDFLQTYPLYFYGLAAGTIVSLFLLVAIWLYFQFFITWPDLFSQMHIIIVAFPDPVITLQMHARATHVPFGQPACVSCLAKRTTLGGSWHCPSCSRNIRLGH